MTTSDRTWMGKVFLILISAAALGLLVTVAMLCQPKPPLSEPAPGSSSAPSASASAEIEVTLEESAATPWLKLEDSKWGIGGKVQLELSSRAAHLDAGLGPWDHQPYPWLLVLEPNSIDDREVCGFFPQVRDGVWRVAQCYTWDPKEPRRRERLRLAKTQDGRLEVALGDERLLRLDRVGME